MKKCKIDIDSLKVLAPNYEESEMFNKLHAMTGDATAALEKYVMLSTLPVSQQNLLVDMGNRLGIDYEVISSEEANAMLGRGEQGSKPNYDEEFISNIVWDYRRLIKEWKMNTDPYSWFSIFKPRYFEYLIPELTDLNEQLTEAISLRNDVKFGLRVPSYENELEDLSNKVINLDNKIKRLVEDPNGEFMKMFNNRVKPIFDFINSNDALKELVVSPDHNNIELVKIYVDNHFNPQESRNDVDLTVLSKIGNLIATRNDLFRYDIYSILAKDGLYFPYDDAEYQMANRLVNNLNTLQVVFSENSTSTFNLEGSIILKDSNGDYYKILIDGIIPIQSRSAAMVDTYNQFSQNEIDTYIASGEVDRDSDIDEFIQKINSNTFEMPDDLIHRYLQTIVDHINIQRKSISEYNEKLKQFDIYNEYYDAIKKDEQLIELYSSPDESNHHLASAILYGRMNDQDMLVTPYHVKLFKDKHGRNDFHIWLNGDIGELKKSKKNYVRVTENFEKGDYTIHEADLRDLSREDRIKLFKAQDDILPSDARIVNHGSSSFDGLRHRLNLRNFGWKVLTHQDHKQGFKSDDYNAIKQFADKYELGEVYRNNSDSNIDGIEPGGYYVKGITLVRFTPKSRKTGNTVGFYLNGKTYLIKDKFNNSTVVHEFLHPLVDALYSDNRELFDSLLSDLFTTQEGQEIEQRVNTLYSDRDQATRHKEILVRALTRAAMTNIDENTGKPLASALKRFLEWLKSFFTRELANKLVQGKTITVRDFDMNTTIQEIADIATMYEGKLNLGFMPNSQGEPQFLYKDENDNYSREDNNTEPFITTASSPYNAGPHNTLLISELGAIDNNVRFEMAGTVRVDEPSRLNDAIALNKKRKLFVDNMNNNTVIDKSLNTLFRFVDNKVHYNPDLIDTNTQDSDLVVPNKVVVLSDITRTNQLSGVKPDPKAYNQIGQRGIENYNIYSNYNTNPMGNVLYNPDVYEQTINVNDTLEALEDYSKRVIFDDSENGSINAFTGLPEHNHSYTNTSTGTLLDTSVTGLKADYDNLGFDKITFFKELLNNPEYRTIKKLLSVYMVNVETNEKELNVEQTNARITKFISLLVSGKHDELFTEYPNLLSPETLARFKNKDGKYIVTRFSKSEKVDNRKYRGEDPDDIFFMDDEQWDPDMDEDEFFDNSRHAKTSNNMIIVDHSDNGMLVTHRTYWEEVELGDVELRDAVRNMYYGTVDKLRERLKSWELSNVAGSRLHKSMQALMIEDNDPKNTSELQEIKKYFETEVPIKIQEFKDKLVELETKYGVSDTTGLYDFKGLKARLEVVKNAAIDELVQLYSVFNTTELALVGLRRNSVSGRIERMTDDEFKDSGAIGLLGKLEAHVNKNSEGYKATNGEVNMKWLRQDVKKNPSKYRPDQVAFINSLSDGEVIRPFMLKYHKDRSNVTKEFQAKSQELDNEIEELNIMGNIIYDKQFYDNAMSLRESIKSKGGIIRTEFIVHHDAINSIDGNSTVSVGGSIDMFVLYPNGEYELYDFKTMKYEPIVNSPEYYFRDRSSGKLRGFTPNKQAEYAFQMLMYQRMIEESDELKGLNLKHKGSYIVPIHTPNIMTLESNPRYGLPYGSYGLVDMSKNTNHRKNPDMNMFTIDIKTFRGLKTDNVDHWSYAETMYEVGKRLSSSRVEQVELSEEEKVILETRKSAKDSRISKLLQEMRNYVSDELRKLNKSSKSEINKERLTNMLRLSNDLEILDNADALWTFVLDSADEIKRLVTKYEETIAAFKLNNMDLREAIRRIDDIRVILDSYSIISEIREVLEDDAKTMDSADLAKLDEAANIVGNTLNSIDLEVRRLMAKNLAKYISQDANTSGAQFINAIVARRKEELAKLEQDLSTTADKVKLEKKIAIKRADIERWENSKNKMVIDEEFIMSELEQMTEDISGWQRWFLHAGSSSDSVLGLFTKLLRFNTYDMELELQRDTIELEKKVMEALKDVRVLPENVASFYEDMLETIEVWQDVDHQEIDEETGLPKIVTRRELVKATALIDNYGRREHTLSDGTVANLSYKEIMTDYRYRIAKLRREHKLVDAFDLQKEYDQWIRDNMMDEYTDEYYQWKNYLVNNGELGMEVQQELDDIQRSITRLKEDILDDTLMNDDQRFSLALLTEKRRRMSSDYDNMGNLKDARELEKAKLYRESLAMFGNIHDSSTNQRLYEIARRKAIIKYGYGSPEYFKWLHENEVVEHNQDFYDKYQRLKLTRDMHFANALYNIPALANFLYDPTKDKLSDSDYVKEASLLLESVNYKELMRRDDSALHEEINGILNPYKFNDEVHVELLSDEQKKRIKELEHQLANYEYEGDMTDILRNALAIKDFYNLELSMFAEYVPTAQYYSEYAKAEKQAKEQGIDVTQTKWFDDNHVTDRKGNLRPIRIWTKIAYVNNTKKLNNLYNQDKETQLSIIRDAIPGRSEVFYMNELKKTVWYKNNHDSNGKLNTNSITTMQYLEFNESEYVIRKPGYKYTSHVVKPEFKNSDALDKNGNLLPKQEMWINPNYEKLQKSSSYKLYQVLREFYEKAQDKLPLEYSNKMGLVLPFIEKGSREIIMSGDKASNKRKELKDLIKSKFSDFATDENTTGSRLNRGVGIDSKTLVMPFTSYIAQEQVSKDVLSSIMQFASSAYQYKSKEDIVSDARSLASVVRKRDAERGVPVTDSVGKRIMRRIKSVKGEYQQEPETARQESYMQQHMLAIINSLIFNEMNTPSSAPVMGFNVRLDKVAGMAQGIASMTQIGGLTWSAMGKGISNKLQAAVMLNIERFSGEYLSKLNWNMAKWLYENKDVTRDALHDLGKITRTSLTGQMFDIYEPLQGEGFIDKYGNKINGTRLSKLFSTDTWYLNQNLPEYQNAMMTLFAMLNSYKIIDGEVYSKQDYMKKRANEDGKDIENLLLEDITKYQSEHDAIKYSLMDAYKLDDSGKLVIGEVDGKAVNWEIGSKRDKEMKSRMQAISTKLNGAYAGSNRADIQKHWAGRLLMMYRKYFPHAIRARYGKLQRDEELGDIHEGYHRTFFRMLFKEYKTLGNILIGRAGKTKISPKELANIRRAFREYSIFLLLFALGMLLAPDDDDRDETSELQWFILYEMFKTQKEIGALIPQPGFVNDNWKLLSSPSSIIGLVNKVLGFAGQLGQDLAALLGYPFGLSEGLERYEQGGPGYEKDDSKLVRKLIKLLNTVSPIQPSFSESYGNLDRG